MAEMVAAERDDDAVSRFTERFAAVLTEAGIPRMPARVFAALLAADSGRLTAAELAGQLQASPAAVSGGVRYLIGVGMVRREGRPGSRRHHYQVPDNVWDEVIRIRDRLMARWTAVLRDGIELLGADTPAGARLADSVRYFEFVSAELPHVLARWQEHKAALDDADRGGADGGGADRGGADGGGADRGGADGGGADRGGADGGGAGRGGADGGGADRGGADGGGAGRGGAGRGGRLP